MCIYVNNCVAKNKMDLQQSVQGNSSCRSTCNTAGILAPPLSNITITTTNVTPTVATATTNNGDITVSPNSSPNADVNHQHNNHHHHRTQSIVTQKSNQVSTVLLYGIPIVSLYIEGQERLCLAQISNTLLKQFSYNEIHNRRVALGITCVQCTPVQLEILRRAGAMPVSSRRCGMITRREAERLCKSFLGDNSPPRLPEDFAFNVQHKCAWGCRGSFMPARYNSSRAKCIKCHYCGMFFSPNKFIFHSHRIGPSDKYVQPDAANFNSWRRHMTLSGQPPQEVIYAWEDVKAMFNGGTRKRLMKTCSSSPIHRVRNLSPNSSSAGGLPNSVSGEQITTNENDYASGESLNKTIKKVKKPLNAPTATPAVVGVTTVAVESSVGPLNLNYQSSASAELTSESSSYSVGTDMHLIPAAALSRSFMMDYVWQQAHQASKNTYHQHYQQQPQQQKLKGSSSAFSLPWIKATVGTSFESQIQDNSSVSDHKSYASSLTNAHYASPLTTRWTNSTTSDITRNLTEIINTSAFKPVLQHQQQAISFASAKTRRMQTTHHTMPVPTIITAIDSTAHPSSLPPINHSSATHADQFPDKTFKNVFSSSEDNDSQQYDKDDCNENLSNDEVKRYDFTDESDAMDDDIMVDIETTEDDKPLTFSVKAVTACNRKSFTAEIPDSPDDNEHDNLSDDDVIDVVHNDNDDTVLEFSSLTPLTIIKHNRGNDRISMDLKTTYTSPVSIHKSTKDFLYNIDKLNDIDYSNVENVTPPPQSVSPNLDSNSSNSRSSECLYVQTKGDKNNTQYEANASVPSLKSPETNDDQIFNFNAIRFDNSQKFSRKRPSADPERRPDECSAIETVTKYKKKTDESSSKGAQLIEALTQKYELTYFNSNNNNSFKSSYNNNNSNNNNTSILNNNNTNNNSNEFWHMARLCMQRPVNYEQNQKAPQHQQQPEHQNNHQKLTRLPTFYYRQQQFILTPTEQQQQLQQQQLYSSHALPASQQVYLKLQQNIQAVQTTQNSQNDEAPHSTNPTSSNVERIAYINIRGNCNETASKHA